MSSFNPLLLCASNISKHYMLEKTRVEVLFDVSLEVPEGETVAIMGASGAGKSTLLHVLGGLDRPTTGSVSFKGRDVYGMSAARRTVLRCEEIGFVFQAFQLLPELNVVENVMLPAMAQRGFLRSQKLAAERGRYLLGRVGLSHRANHRPYELSGGEQQRVAIARALMNEPCLLLADEPTGNLDSKTGESVLKCLFSLTEETRHTLVMVTHNEVVAGMCHRKLVLMDGRLSL